MSIMSHEDQDKTKTTKQIKDAQWRFFSIVLYSEEI